jgi:hypothetical protein
MTASRQDRSPSPIRFAHSCVIAPTGSATPS